MKQYKITFYHVRNKKGLAYATYYREFENMEDAKEWAKSVMDESLLINNFHILLIHLDEFILNTA